MTLAAAAFASGAAALQLQAELPAMAWLLALPMCAAVCYFQPRLAALFAFVIGLLWAAGAAHLRMADWLAPELEGRDLEVVGVVAGLPALSERAVRFEFELEASSEQRLPRKLLLAWYRSPWSEDGAALMEETVHPGERWLFTVRLRRPHGHVNPHGFDYEAWLLERSVGATGYVRTRGERKRLGTRNHVLDYVERVREAVRERFKTELGATPAAGILTALAVGDQRAISAEEWRLFNRTGVTHLMSISGLHVTLVSGLAAWLVSFGWRRVPPAVVRLPARKAAAAAAIAAALGYTLLAGFAVPAQRTFWMVSVVAAALWCGRVAAPARTLALALAVVVATDPWAPLAPGMWLSFGAVALIFYVATNEWRIAQWGRMQWAITVGLAPAALLLFGQISVAGPLANALAIPLVSVVITPIALAAVVFPLELLLQAAAWLVQWLLAFLEWCAALPGALWQQHTPPVWAVALAMAGAVWMLAPRGVPWRAGGLALMAPAFSLAPPTPARGEAWVTALDVGQGLAVLVRTANRALLYDAGPAYGPEADSGGRIVVPLLRATGVRSVDLLILSHEDIDHLGGALTLLESLEVHALASSLPRSHPLHSLALMPGRCAAGMAWDWDGVRFEFLHPPAGWETARRNNQSCVLRIAAGASSMLLTGDIERAAELSLLENKIAASDILLVPHHGSRTSSSSEFIAAVTPRWAIVPAGYRNRFGHPAREVLERYARAGIPVLRTDRDGAISVVLDGHAPRVSTERSRAPRYWRRTPPV
ncbi:MAG TPA: DNA internalization-related competence protein ComEC/Rec2 [Burkholderiales bacterium]|nr:DNA internalization-related competence protein ComEC/Rec2 [Burkholderiales bacterium]